MPPIELQSKFARIVEKIEAMRQSQNQSKQQIEDLFSALMQKAFRGDLDKSKREIKCVQCASQTKEATDITLITAVEGREVVITGLTGTRCPTCGEEYTDAESAEKVEGIVKKFRKPAIVFKRKITKSGGRRVLGIPEEIDRALGKKENVDIWLEDDKIVAEVY